MAGEWLIVDPNNYASVLFDLDDASGAGNPQGVPTAFGLGGSFDIGSPDTQLNVFSPSGRSGGYTLNHRDPLVNSTWRQRMGLGQKDYSLISSAAGYLGTLIARGGILKLPSKLAVVQKYIAFEPSRAPALWQGKPNEMQFMIQRLDTPDGVDMSIWRQPGILSDTLNSYSNVLINASLLVAHTSPNSPDLMSWDNTGGVSNQRIDALNDAFTFTFSTTTLRTLSHTTLYATALPGDIWTISVEGWSSKSGLCQAQLSITYYNNVGTPLRTDTQTLTSLSTVPNTRISFASAAAPANTVNVSWSIGFKNLANNAANVWIARAQLEKGANSTLYVSGSEVVSADPAAARGHIKPVFIQGDYPVPVTVRAKAGASSQIAALFFAKRSAQGIVGNRRLVDLLNTTHWFSLSGGTAGTDITSMTSADALASEGTAVEVSYATTPTMARRVRYVYTPSDPLVLDSLRGTFGVYLRGRNGGASLHFAQVNVATNSVDPANQSFSEVPFDSRGSTSQDYVWQRMGQISIPDQKTALVSLEFEVWSRRGDSSTDHLFLDYIELVPEDDESFGAWVLVASGAGQQWLGSQMITPPTNFSSPTPTAGTALTDTGLMNLNANTQAAATPRIAPLAGHQVFTVEVTTFDPGATAAKIGELRIRDITSNTDVLVVDVNGKSKSPWFRRIMTIAFDSTAAHTYELQAWQTTASRVFDVFTVNFTTQPFLATGEYVRTDPERFLIEHLDANLKSLGNYRVVGPTPMMFEPGFHLLYVVPNNYPLPGYSQVANSIGNTVTVDIAYNPRWRNP